MAKRRTPDDPTQPDLFSMLDEPAPDLAQPVRFHQRALIRIGAEPTTPAPPAPQPAPAVAAAEQPAPVQVQATDFDGAHLVEPPTSRKAQAADNIAALTVLRQLEAQERAATPDEQHTLARWRGWGGLDAIFASPADNTDPAWWAEALDRDIAPQLANYRQQAGDTAADQAGTELRQITGDPAGGRDAAASLTTLAASITSGPAGTTAAAHKLAETLKTHATIALWAPERAQLIGLTSPAEREAAAETSMTAYYTDPAIATEMWRALEGLGYTGGPVLEPGCGAGVFIGQAPAGAELVGVDVDPITTAIARHLYPSADIVTAGFQGQGWNPGSLDAVIGNVPFGNFKLYDAGHNPQGFTIHNHFLLKSVQLVAPGGLVMAITSASTLDNQRAAVRDALHRSADLVGAVRLPAGAFAAAGTDVVTDILILRRRMADEAPAPAQTWREQTHVPADGGLAPINTYYAQHPENVIGQLRATTNQYGNTIAASRLEAGADLAAELRSRLQTIVQRAHANGLTHSVDRTVARPAPHAENMQAWEADHKPGSIREIEDGTLVKKTTQFERLDPASSTWQPYPVPKTHAAEMRALLALRDAITDLLATQRDGDDDAKAAARTHATDMYRKYTGPYGPVNRYETKLGRSWVLVRNIDADQIDPDWPTKQRGADKGRPEYDDDGQPVMQVRRETLRQVRPRAVELMRTDPDFAAVLAVEDFDEDTHTATPGAVLSRDVITPAQPPTHVDNAADALAVVLNQTGQVDLEAIAALITGRPSLDDVRAELGDLVFSDPDQGGHLTPAVSYLSGHVRNKLAAAQAAAEADPDTYSRNVAALEAIQPALLTPADIEVRPGVTWITPADYRQFISEVLDIKAGVEWSTVHNEWQIDASSPWSDASNRTYGTPAVDGITLFGHLMNNAPTVVNKLVVDYDGRERTVTDPEATELAGAKKAALADRFSSWVWADPARAERLADVYNARFNSWVAPKYTGEHLTFPGIGNQYQPRPTQAAAVARIIDQPTVLLDHVVGAGKTGTMVCAAMELRRLGLARQPWIVVPNHLVEQVAREAKQWYPDAQILTGTSGTNAEQRRELVALTATSDYDMVVLPESTFTGIPVSADTQADYIREQLAGLEEAADARAGSSARGTRAERRLKSAKKNLEAKLQSLREEGKAGTDTGLTFEASGCDYLFVDEAHHYKNRMVISHDRDLSRQEDSQRALDLALKLRVLRTERAADGRAARIATFATGTPIANSPREMWVMLDYLRPDLLESAGVGTFDAWAQNHLRAQTRLEMKSTGSGFQTRTRTTAFVNVPEMSRMWRQVADLVTREDLPVKLPTMVGGTRQITSIDRSPEQAEYAEVLDDRVEAIKATAVAPEVDNMLLVSNDGRAVALDQRLVGLDAPADGGKPSAIVANIMRIHTGHQNTEYRQADGAISATRGGLQVVFLDASTPKPGQWNLYKQIRGELVDAGMDADQIRFIHDAPAGRARLRLFQDCRDGKVSVLIGSTMKLGTGANIQDRITAIHHADVPWRPDYLEQREGRGIRQGNQNDQLEICTYVTENTYDAYSWNLIAVKAQFISQIKNGTTARHVDIDDSDADNYELIAAVSSGDPRILERHQLGLDLAKLERLERAYKSEQRGITSDIRRLTQIEAELPERIEAAATVADQVRPTDGDHFRAAVGGAVYTQRADAARALYHTVAAAFNQHRAVISRTINQDDVLTVGGLSFRLQAAAGRDYALLALQIDRRAKQSLPHTIQIEGKDIGSPDSIGLIRRAENLVAKLPETVRQLEATLADTTQQLAGLHDMTGQRFPHADQLNEVRSRLRQLDIELATEAAAEDLDPKPPAWMGRLTGEQRAGIVWGPRLHRVHPDGTITAGQTRVGDILAAEKVDSGVRLVEAVGHGGITDISVTNLKTGAEETFSKRATTVIGIVARSRDNLTGIQTAIAESAPADSIIELDDANAGDHITAAAVPLAGNNQYGSIDDDRGVSPFTPTAVTVGSISDETVTIRHLTYGYRQHQVRILTAEDGTRYAIDNTDGRPRVIKHPAPQDGRSPAPGRTPAPTLPAEPVRNDSVGIAPSPAGHGPATSDSDGIIHDPQVDTEAAPQSVPGDSDGITPTSDTAANPAPEQTRESQPTPRPAHTPQPADTEASDAPDAARPDGREEPVIHHHPGGTVVTGTEKDDAVMRAALKTAGFKWSSRQGYWYLPRTWRVATREHAVSTVVNRLRDEGRSITITQTPHDQTDPQPQTPASPPAATHRPQPGLSLGF